MTKDTLAALRAAAWQLVAERGASEAASLVEMIRREIQNSQWQGSGSR